MNVLWKTEWEKKRFKQSLPYFVNNWLNCFLFTVFTDSINTRSKKKETKNSDQNVYDDSLKETKSCWNLYFQLTYINESSMIKKKRIDK